MSKGTVTVHPSPGMPTKNVDRFRGPCGKVCYGSMEDAELDSRRLFAVAAFHGNRVRAYPCPTCKCWHLSSKPRSGKTRYIERKTNA